MIDAASKGDAAAQATVGDYCYSVKDYPNAVTWYKRAAASGNTDAQLSLAACYRRGHGVKQNRTTAARWARLALVQRAAEPEPEPEPPPEADPAAKPQAAPGKPAPLTKPQAPSPVASHDPSDKPCCTQRVRKLRRPEPALQDVSLNLKPANNPD